MNSDVKLTKFLSTLQMWTQKIRAGELAARIPVSPESELSDLSQDINFVAEMLESLSRDAEIQLQRHTEHIARKNKSQETLYDVVTSINMSRNVQELLTHFLHTMKELVDARGAAVFLETKKDAYALIAEVGMEAVPKNELPFLPEDVPDSNEQRTVPIRVVPCPDQTSQDIFNGEILSVLIVPLQYRGKILGVYNLYVEEDKFKKDSECKELFTSMGRHLGIAVEKARLDDEAKALSIMRERTSIANELHDSLAQTLASIRYQVRVLDETIHQGDEAATWQELERIESTIDEAHTELRALIAHFRLPIGERSLTVSVEQVIERFKQDSDDIQVYLQKEWPDTMLPPQIELQVLRVIQEALTNVRKHSEAGTVRVLMRGDGGGRYTVLIEDDGMGMTDLQKQNAAGEHVGISVMQDRANRIGGTLTVDGEPGEGVQVRFEFNYLPGSAQDNAQHEMV